MDIIEKYEKGIPVERRDLLSLINIPSENLLMLRDVLPRPSIFSPCEVIGYVKIGKRWVFGLPPLVIDSQEKEELAKIIDTSFYVRAGEYFYLNLPQGKTIHDVMPMSLSMSSTEVLKIAWNSYSSGIPNFLSAKMDVEDYNDRRYDHVIGKRIAEATRQMIYPMKHFINFGKRKDYLLNSLTVNFLQFIRQDSPCNVSMGISATGNKRGINNVSGTVFFHQDFRLVATGTIQGGAISLNALNQMKKRQVIEPVNGALVKFDCKNKSLISLSQRDMRIQGEGLPDSGEFLISYDSSSAIVTGEKTWKNGEVCGYDISYTAESNISIDKIIRQILQAREVSAFAI